MTDEYFMHEALKEARKAFDEDEVPVGAVMVIDDRIIARGHNMTEKLKDVTAHAEMICCTSAASFLNSKYLLDCTLYVTLEPCVMCAGAGMWTQVKRIVFGAYDMKKGYSLYSKKIFLPKTQIVGGLMAEECAAPLKEYFLNKRNG